MAKAKDKKISVGAVIYDLGSTINNKTGDWRTFRPVFDTERCHGCGFCTNFCPEGVIEIKEINGKKIAVTDYNFCKGCGICVEECPFQAIMMKKEEK